MMMNELDALVYGGKKVTRADLEASGSDDENAKVDVEGDFDEDEEIDSDEYG